MECRDNGGRYVSFHMAHCVGQHIGRHVGQYVGRHLEQITCSKGCQNYDLVDRHHREAHGILAKKLTSTASSVTRTGSTKIPIRERPSDVRWNESCSTGCAIKCHDLEDHVELHCQDPRS